MTKAKEVVDNADTNSESELAEEGGHVHGPHCSHGHHHHHHEPQAPMKREAPKVGRNDPCVCGSGKKYKKCCGK